MLCHLRHHLTPHLVLRRLYLTCSSTTMRVLVQMLSRVCLQLKHTQFESPATAAELVYDVFVTMLSEVVSKITVSPQHLQNERKLADKLFKLVAKKVRLVPKAIIAGKELTDAEQNHQVRLEAVWVRGCGVRF